MLMKRLIAVSICLAVCASAAAAERPAVCGESPVPLKWQPPIKDFSGELPIADYLDTATACQKGTGQWRLPAPPEPPEPRSAWLESERALYKDVLAHHRVDVLVVPFQVQGYGLDRIERTLMTAELAYALGDATKYEIADPFLVARALGEGARRIDPMEAERLAQRLGATRIISGYVGHDLHHAFTLTLQVQDLPTTPTPSRQRPWQHDWRAVPFTDERTPALVFNDMLPDMLRVLPVTLQMPQHPTQVAVDGNAARITMSPRELVSAGGSGAVAPSAAAAFDLLGALGPLNSELARERAYERALLAVLRRGGRTVTDCFYSTYALMQLSRRPAALAALVGQSSRESIALLALLNGDLPGAKKAVAGVPQSLQRLLLDSALRDLEAWYAKKLQATPAATTQTFGAAKAQWQPFVELRVMDLDQGGWAVPDPLVIKALLDETFPIAGLDAKSIIHGNAVTAVSIDEVDIDLANERHVRRSAATLQPAPCCKAGELRPTGWDLLWLLEGLSEDRISKSLRREIDQQGLPEDALEAIHRYEPLLNGRPTLELSRSRAAFAIYQKSADDTRASWHAQFEQSAAVAARFAPGQTATAYTALLAMGIPSAESSILVDAYGYDYPRRSYWPMWFFGVQPGEPQATSLALEALAFSVHDPGPLNWLPPGNEPGHVGAMIASLGSRFTGSPQRPVPKADQNSAPAPKARLAQLERAIHADPETWSNYLDLGWYLITGGSYEAASDAFLRYPGFHDPHPEEPIAVSNYAFSAGSKLYWMGMPALARPFYRISADLHTGSEYSMTGEARLHLMDGDYAGAATLALERARRYNSAAAYRDYLSLLYAFGRSEEAWQAFSQLKASFREPLVWVAALVGQQKQGLSNAGVRQWLMRPEIRDTHFATTQFAPYYAILWYGTERMPPADLGKLVEQLEGPPAGRIDVDGRTLLVPSDEGEGKFEIVHPSGLRAGKAPALPPDTPIKSHYAYFADAYAALRLGDYATAVTRFVAMADRYDLDGYPLAYFAYAAAKTGDSEKLEQYLGQLKGPPGFDDSLARAFFAAARKDDDAALRALHTAFPFRHGSDFRPILDDYEYAQVCEWLFRDTGDKRFSALLLDWVRKYQTLQPTTAWAYAIEYAYEAPGLKRTRALALTLYLDPASERIESATTQERDTAHAWLREHNPFRIPAESSDRSRNVTTMLRSSLPVGYSGG
jgi:hypothetical protein